MILPLLAMIAAQQTSQSAVSLGSYEINPVVAPHFRRYAGCIEDHVRDHVVQPASTAVLREAYDQAVSACADVRRTEYEQAERALARSRTIADAGERRRAVDEAFRAADRTRNQYGEAVRREMREQQSLEARLDPSAVAAAKLETDQPVVSTDVPVARLNIPDEIGPAIQPYLDCLFASRGTIFRPGADGFGPRPPGVTAGSDCTPQREEAARRADQLLRSRGRGNRDQRRALIETTLANADNFVTGPGGPNPPPPDGKNDAED